VLLSRHYSVARVAGSVARRFVGAAGIWITILTCLVLARLSEATPLATPTPIAAGQIHLPIEVFGNAGSTVVVPFELGPTKAAAQPRTIRIRVHGLHFADMASVRLNNRVWIDLNNTTTTVAEPGRSYGGIGGAFATLDLTIPLPARSVNENENSIAFRFNRTDGVVSGFRILSFNLLDGQGHGLISTSPFTQDNPNLWTPPLAGGQDRAAGRQLWYSAPLIANSLPHANSINAHCADCHAQDGRDLHYFNYSNESIIARSEFHGLSELQGKQIATYIRQLTGPAPGRPWNPPFQPGPGLSARPPIEWAAGAGLQQVLSDDADALKHLFSDGGGSIRITADAFRPDSQLNPREIPIALQLPDWNHWLPRVHPKDAWGAAFTESKPMLAYQTLRSMLASDQADHFISTGAIVQAFAGWVRQRDEFLKPRIPATVDGWTPAMTDRAYSTQLWQLVKTWELDQEFAIGSHATNLPGGSGEMGTWLNTIPAATSPASLRIPDSPSGMGSSGIGNEYFNNAWYELQLLVDGSNHGRNPAMRVDWVYQLHRYLDLQQLTHHAEPGRALVAIICALQSTNPSAGPADADGWQPDRNVDPRILVAPEWADTFATLAPEYRLGLANAMLEAWLEKNRQYPIARYFNRFLNQGDYIAPKELRNITGGHVWEASSLFAAEGVRPSLVHQLQVWGRQSIDMAARFSY
jgi:hypothetical protein